MNWTQEVKNPKKKRGENHQSNQNRVGIRVGEFRNNSPGLVENLG